VSELPTYKPTKPEYVTLTDLLQELDRPRRKEDTRAARKVSR